MKVEQPRITARVDLEIQDLLKEASPLVGISSINALAMVLQKKHKNISSAGFIARLGVDTKYKQKGYGE